MGVTILAFVFVILLIVFVYLYGQSKADPDIDTREIDEQLNKVADEREREYVESTKEASEKIQSNTSSDNLHYLQRLHRRALSNKDETDDPGIG